MELPGGGRRPTTVVAVLTYRRTHLLPRLLGELVSQARSLVPAATVLVVDNDPLGDAAAVVGDWAAHGVRYVHEQRPGISAARNRALDAAADADLLVFIDDDELPAPGWLAALIGAWAQWDCAAVAGPVTARLMGPADSWVLGSGLFDRRRLPSGTRLEGAASNNLLLDLRRVRRHGLSFDPRFGLTGGEDSLFTRQLSRAGEQIRWCDEAGVVELIHAERLTRRWVLMRSFRTGSAYSSVRLHLTAGVGGRWWLRAVLLAKACGRTALASVHWAGATVRRDVAAGARALCTMASYAGLAAGAVGYVHQEYARTPATSAAGRAEEPSGVGAR